MEHDIAADPDLADYVSHEEFREGLPRGRFRVIVNPKLARAFVRQRLWLLPVVIALVGAGVAIALSGATWPGLLLVVGAIAVNRVIAWNAGKILLHLAAGDKAVYMAATEHAVMEVRRAA